MQSNSSTEQAKSEHDSDLSCLFSFSSVTRLSLFGQSGFKIQNIRNTHIYTKVQKEPPNVHWFGLTTYPATNRALATYTPESPCIAFCPLRTHPQESCESLLVLKALAPTVNNHLSFQKRVCIKQEQGCLLLVAATQDRTLPWKYF